MPARPYAVVIGLDSITGLQTARILDRRDVPVVALAENPRHFCCRTRACERVIAADTATEQLVEELERVGPALGDKAVLFPCTDMSVLLVSRHRERLDPWYHVVLPPHDVVAMLTDKLSFYSYAEQQGLPIPRTFLLRTRRDAEEAAKALSYPAVLKPSLRTSTWDQHTSDKAFKVWSSEELLDVYDRAAEWAEVVLTQEWIPGGETNLFSCNCYFDAEARALVTFVARKIRQWPPQTGISSLGEECRNDVVLRETLRLFEGVRFRGLGYVEMKRHEETGEHFIIEPNIGRPTGRSAIAETGGVELLYTKYCDVVGLPLPRNRRQRYGDAKWIYLRSDLQSAAHYWRRGELTVGDWWRSVRGCRNDAVISLRDPAPFVFDLWRGARLLVGGERRARESRPPAHEPERAPAPARVRAASALHLEPVESLDAIREEWSELAEKSENIFATWEWTSIWWRHHGGGRRSLVTACRSADGRLVALLPLYLFSTRPLRIARFVGHGPADQLGPISAPEDRARAGEALAHLLEDVRPDIFLAEQLPGNEGWASILGGKVLSSEGSPLLRFEGRSWDALLGSWSANRRSQVRRLERKLAREHGLCYRLVDEPAALEESLETLFALHAARWGDGHSSFADPSQAAFHREFAAVALERGWLRLWFLEADDRPVSAWYGFRFAGVDSYYQAGRDPAWERESVGLVLLVHTIRDALEGGMREYRFLRGGEAFKYRFANGDPRLETIGVPRGPVGKTAFAATAMLSRPTVRGALRQWLSERSPARTTAPL